MNTVFIVDDHPAIHSAFKMLIDRQKDMYVSDTASSATQALQKLAERKRPDLVLIDVLLDDMSGLDLTRTIQQQWPDLPVLVMSAFGENGFAETALRVGAKGFIDKNHTEHLITAIRHILNGEQYVISSPNNWN